MTKALPHGFHNARHEIAAHENTASALLRGLSGIDHFRSVARRVAVQSGYTLQEARALDSAMSRLLVDLPTVEQRRRTHALLVHLTATTTRREPEHGLCLSGRITETFLQANEQAWQKVPLACRTLLLEEEFSFTVCETSLKAFPSSAKDKSRATEEDPRTHIIHKHGLFRLSVFKGCSAEFYLDHKYDIDDTGSHVTPQGILEGRWNVSERTGQTILHETAHALNALFEKYIGVKVSDTEVYSTAFMTDILEMGGYEGAREKGYDYFVRNDMTKSKNESFAELMAIRWEGKKKPVMASDFKHCYAFIKRFSPALVKAHEAGLTSLMLSINGLDRPAQEAINPTLITKWQQLLRTRAAVSDDDIRGWRDHAPKAAMLELVKNTLTGGPAQKNDERITDRLIHDEVEKTMDPENIDAGYQSLLAPLSGLPAFRERVKAAARTLPPVLPPKTRKSRLPNAIPCA